jgi:hypothetical protein
MDIKAKYDGKRGIDSWPCVRYPAIDHCEVNLVAFLKYWQEAIDILDPELISMLQVRTRFSMTS